MGLKQSKHSHIQSVKYRSVLTADISKLQEDANVLYIRDVLNLWQMTVCTMYWVRLLYLPVHTEITIFNQCSRILDLQYIHYLKCTLYKGFVCIIYVRKLRENKMLRLKADQFLRKNWFFLTGTLKATNSTSQGHNCWPTETENGWCKRFFQQFSFAVFLNMLLSIKPDSSGRYSTVKAYQDMEGYLCLKAA